MAAIGAIIALLAVGYEIRQSNRIATQQALTENWSNWVDYASSKLNAGISKTIAKSMIAPEGVSLEEKIDLEFYLSAWLYLNHQNYISLLYDSDIELSKLVLEDISGEAPAMLDSGFAKAWFLKNTYWMAPEIVKAVETAIEDLPLGSGLEYYRSIDALAETLNDPDKL